MLRTKTLRRLGERENSESIKGLLNGKKPGVVADGPRERTKPLEICHTWGGKANTKGDEREERMCLAARENKEESRRRTETLKAPGGWCRREKKKATLRSRSLSDKLLVRNRVGKGGSG